MSNVILSEEWRPVVGYEGLYEVSNLGQIRGVERLRPHPNKHQNTGSFRRWQGKIIKQNLRSGYPSVTLHANDKGRSCMVHQLVLEAFVGPCPEGMECRHFPDRSKLNNRIDNLQWGTRKQNAEDRDAHGQTARGDAHSTSVLTAKLVAEIRSAYRPRKVGLKALGRKYGVHFTTIHMIVSGKTWRPS